MNLLLLGGPGAGKGTQAKVLAKKLSIPHISTGDIFRYNIKNQTPLGLKVKTILDEGKLVPDSVTNDIVKDRLQQDDCKDGFILDGYPRTIPQAEFLDTFLSENDANIDFVLNIDVTDDCILRRISGRRICNNCGAMYHIPNNPPKVNGVCDQCEKAIIQRDDDKEDTVKERIAVYHKQTEPLIDFYKSKNVLYDIDGERDVDVILEDILALLGRQS